jgi:biotin transport system substrate-specific component
MTEITLRRASALPFLSLSRPWQYVSAAIVGTAFIALCAHIFVPLFFTPVPLTLEPFAVLVLGLLMGPRLGFATLALYLAEGAAGLPVFSPHGVGGVAQLLGSTGGYLLSYPFAAALMGALWKRLPKSYTSALVSAAAGNVLILAAGATWLGIYLHQSMTATLSMAVVPFLPGDALKVVTAAGIAVAACKWRMRRAQNQ